MVEAVQSRSSVVAGLGYGTGDPVGAGPGHVGDGAGDQLAGSGNGAEIAGRRWWNPDVDISAWFEVLSPDPAVEDPAIIKGNIWSRSWRIVSSTVICYEFKVASWHVEPSSRDAPSSR